MFFRNTLRPLGLLPLANLWAGGKGQDTEGAVG
jgi:hypothetical protein